MPRIDLLPLKPFETCSIRPPTENSSLTFRLTRNCHWNKCTFCPVYKIGSGFKKRPLREIFDDIESAKRIDDAMFDYGVGYPRYSEADYGRAAAFIGDMRREQREAGIIDHDDDDAGDETEADTAARWFLQWFKNKPSLENSIRHLLAWRIGGSKNCFLGDSDSLIHKPSFITDVVERVKLQFPTLERFTVYGRTKSAAVLRSAGDLKDFSDAGISRVHFGVESGNDRVLRSVNKGSSRTEHIEGLVKTREAGISVSIYIMPGLGGTDLSEVHALDTADVINKSMPSYVRIRTLEMFPGTELSRLRDNGSFTEADEDTVVREIRMLIAAIAADTELFSDSASNLLPLHGRLPEDRNTMLRIIDSYLERSARERLEYSLNSRLASFYGQYGGLTKEIYNEIHSFIKNGKIEPGKGTETDIRRIIKLIRSRLMP